MNSEVVTPELREAQSMLAEVLDESHETAQWCINNAYTALRKLQDEWTSLCSHAELKNLVDSRDKSEELLADCSVLRLCITERAERFAAAARTRLTDIADLAGDDEGIKRLVQQVVDDWNEAVQPRAVRLYEHVEKLEDGIQNVMDLSEQEVLP